MPLKMVNAVARRRVIIINHGELEYITDEQSLPYARSTRWTGRFFKSSLKSRIGAGRIYHLVLGDSIARNLARYRLVDPRHVISVDHPYIFDPRAAKRTAAGAGGVKTVGVKNIRAAFDTDALIARLAAAHPRFTFIILGAFTRLSGANIENHTTKTQRSRDEYEKILGRLDAMIFLYTDAEYRLKASGAIFDCLEHGIPTIAVRNDYFDHLFTLNGSLGYLYPDLDSLESHLDEALAADHSAIRRHIAAARAWHSPENLAVELRHRLNELFDP
jgi:hypothetical protein